MKAIHFEAFRGQSFLGNDRSNFFETRSTGIIGIPVLDKRQFRRRKMVLPVKVLIDKVTHLAHTVDITDAGAAIGGFRMQLQPGTIIALQRGSKKTKFRIAWIRELAPNEWRAGVESLEPQTNFWGVDLSDREKAEEDTKAFMTVLSGGSKSMK